MMVTLFSLFSSCRTNAPNTLQSESFVIVYGDTHRDTNYKWANYLFSHLKKRSVGGPKISIANEATALATGAFILQIDIQPEHTHSYEIVRAPNKLQLIARSEATALWLIYELIERIGEDNPSVDIADLPPATLTFSSSKKDFDFDYREAFLSPNTHVDYARILGNNSIDADWGIWGHQLAQIVDREDSSIWAEVNGKKTNEQLCFSATSLYLQIKAHIIDQHGDAPTLHFMIAPNDNDLVCTCSSCQRAKNTSTNAAAAVSLLINRLAKDFPTARFYMLAYRSTQTAADIPLEKNVGVFISTIDLPKGQKFDENSGPFKAFKQSLNRWKKQTNAIYLWDYAANFDDYLTPIPVLTGFQEQLKTFKSLGIKGIFVNASGYDYAPFDDVKTYVLSALMKDVNSDVPELISRYFKRFYPMNHQLLESFYTQLEGEFQKKSRDYPLYADFETARQSYFDPAAFIPFYNALNRSLSKTKNPEREKLEKLYTALSFTKLQLDYNSGFQPGGALVKIDNQIAVSTTSRQNVSFLRKTAQKHRIKNYSERHDLDTYLNQWQQWMDVSYAENRLTTADLRIKNAELNALADGKLGFNHDFLMGWVIVNKDLNLAIKQLPTTASTVVLRFLNDSTHHIYPPREVCITDFNAATVLYPTTITEEKTLTTYRFHIPEHQPNTALNIQIINHIKPKSQWACDEIQFLKN
ncbi:DUF4838 domain-containing protein [Flavobacterium sp. JP2137]|uniref:DUF4838 domain-containing protein n=1 Tax=Flavobacterium sp. JP2137 TaxID=3414510 RepID=UPI003D3007A1